jgi:hypothetical protein
MNEIQPNSITQRRPSEQPSYILELRAIPMPGMCEPEQRLRRLLKQLLRNFGFRCVNIRPAPAPAPAQAGQGQGQGQKGAT